MGLFLFFLPNALLLIAALILTWTENHTPENMTQMVIFFSLYMLIALPKMLFLIVDLIGKGICLFFPRAKKACTMVSSAASLLLLCIMGAGLSFGPTLLQVRHTNFSSADLPPAFDGYRIVQFSDLHLTSFRNRPEMVEKVVERIMEQCPDMIVFTGDLVSTEANELDGFDEILSRLHAPDGVYSILGNHDYLTYAYYLSPEEQAAQREELKERQRDMNWDLLLNEHRIIRQGRDSIALVGVENDGKPPFPERGDLKKALAGIPGYGQGNDSTHMFKVLLSQTRPTGGARYCRKPTSSSRCRDIPTACSSCFSAGRPPNSSILNGNTCTAKASADCMSAWASAGHSFPSASEHGPKLTS